MRPTPPLPDSRPDAPCQRDRGDPLDRHYSGGLGSIAGVLIADYWLIRDKNLRLADLYRQNGAYRYKAGWNWRAVVATAAGCFFAWIGKFVPSMHILYDYAWFVGFAVGFVVHFALMKIARPEIVATPEAA